MYSNYYLVSHHDVNDFSSEIKYMLKHGWELHGDTLIPAIWDESGTRPLFCQALVKRKEND